MIPAIIIGREKSKGFPGKNWHPVLGRPMMVYPLLAALNSASVSEVYVSTDSAKIKEIALEVDAKIIERPERLCSDKALGEDTFSHAYRYIKKITNQNIGIVVLLFCNAPTVTNQIIEEGIRILKENSAYDSAVSVSKYNMWSPIRARRIIANGLLEPFIPFSVYEDKKALTCDRDSQGDVWFADMGVSVVRSHCLEDLDYGILPQRWMGRKIYPLRQWGGCDVDYEWQMPLVENWLRKHGFSEEKTPYDNH